MAVGRSSLESGAGCRFLFIFKLLNTVRLVGGVL